MTPAGRQALSLPQQAIFLDALLRGATPKFNMGGFLIIQGPLDGELFRQSLVFALATHEAQRMRLHFDGATATQEFLPPEGFPLPFQAFDFSCRDQPLAAAIEWVLADFARPMSLEQFPLHGDVLIRLGPDLHLWYPKFHHVANDALGHAQVAATIASAYTALAAGNPLPEPAPRPYTAFLEEDRAYAASPKFLADAAFWREKFATLPQPLPFTARKGELTGDRLGTERCALGLDRMLYNAVVRRAEEAGVTPFQLLLAGFFAYLGRVFGCEDLVIGTPIMNRSHHGFRSTGGMFMNMMPLRLGFDRDASVLELAARIQAETRSCYRHQRFPFSETLRHCRTLEGFCHGVFDVTVIYRKADYRLSFGGSPLRVVTLDTRAREETLSLEIDDYGGEGELNLFLNHNPQLVAAAEAASLLRGYEALLMEVALAGDLRVRDLRLGGIPVAAPDPGPAAAPQPTVLEEVERRAAEDPEALAAICGPERLTRAALERSASAIADFLAATAGVGLEQPVALLCGRNGGWIAGLLGILKAGCATLPLDPEQPRERLAFLLRDSGCRLLLADADHAGTVFPGVRTVALAEAASGSGPALPRRPVAPDQLAYILYTSGTTGQPKGVRVEHGGLANTVAQLRTGWDLSARDRVLGFAGPMFDAAILDLFLALASGATFVLAAKAVILDPVRFLDLLRTEGVTVATLPPAYLSALGAVELPLRLLVTAGSAANPADVARHLKYLTYVNAYGPTEASVCASYLKLEVGTDFRGGRVAIGRPLEGTRMRVLDADLAPLPVGAAGELCLAGAGLARDYLGQPELTAERFVANPARPGERLYRTGDLGRQLADGTFEFLGRRDSQVKIRGFRVELGEVEAVLKAHPGVADAVVSAWDPGGGAELVATAVARGPFEPWEWRRFLAGKLPGYMVPTRWTALAELPLNGSGKVDRAALPDPAGVPSLRPALGATPARTPLEAVLVEVWEGVLETPGIGVEDDFFELGGHSLKAVRVLAQVQDRIGVRVAMADFFAQPTVAGLATLLAAQGSVLEAPIPATPEQASYPVSNAQARIWVLAQLEGGSAGYNMPLALELQGELQEEALERAFQGVIARHEALRTALVTEGGLPRQRVLAEGAARFELGRVDLTGCPDPEAEARQRLEETFSRPFDLAQAPLLRASALRIGARRWLLALVVHHTVADGWSMNVLLRELALRYAAAVEGREPGLPALALQYGRTPTFVQWGAIC